MQFPNDTVSVLLRMLLRVVLFVVGAVFVLILVCVGIIGFLYVLLKALLTGRKPGFVTTFVQFRQASQQFNPGGWRTRQSANDHSGATGDVIEGQATEVRDDPTLPHKPSDEA